MNQNSLRPFSVIALSLVSILSAYADTAIVDNLTLTADADWRADGVVTVPAGVTVDLNGHLLWVSGLAGEGTFASSVSDSATYDLTTSDASKVSSTTTFLSGTSAANLFNNNYDRGQPTASDLNSRRVIVKNENLPIVVDYDFGVATNVNSYRVYAGGYRGGTDNQNSGHQRTAKHWKFYGSNDEGDTKEWTELDERTVTDWNDKTAADCKQFTFFNGTAYRYYRMEILEPQVLSNGYTELVQLEYGCVGSQVRIDPSLTAGFASASNTVSGTAKFVVGGTLSASADLRGLGNVTVVSKEALDLAGYYLKVHALDAAGKVRTSSTSAFSDLTSSAEAAARATATTNGVRFAMAGTGSGTSDGSKYPPENAFDNNGTSFVYGTGLSSNPIELNYDFGTATYVNRYRICPYSSNSSPGFPKTWTFEGSDDGVNWTTLDSQSNKVLEKSTWYGYTFESNASYRYYRLKVTVRQPSNGRIDIGELEFGVVPYNTVYVNADGVSSSSISDGAVSDGVSLTVTEGSAVVLSGDLDLSAYSAISGTIDLNGHDLTVASLSGGGTITDSTVFDLTDTDATRVHSANTYLSTGPASAAFQNYESYNGSNQRVIANLSANTLPIRIDYDFREATVVNAYRLTVGGNSSSSSSTRNALKNRAPKAFSFWGSNEGGDGEWVKLDERTNETAWYIEQSYQEERQYEFVNASPYRYYRIEFHENNGDAHLEFFKLEYGNIDAAGHLHVVVPSGATVDNSDVAITGNLRLVKEGDGTLKVTKTGQKYGCGTEVRKGTLTMGSTGNNTPLGKAGTEVTVCSNAVVEMNAKANFYFYSFNLAGGTIQNTASDVGDTSAHLKRMRLTDDSILKPTRNYGFIGNNYTESTIYLNGHTLDVQIGVGKDFYCYNTKFLDGTVDITSGAGYLKIDNSAVTATNADFKINCALVVNKQFSARGYEANFYSTGSNSGTAQLTVAGVFKPTVAAYYGCTMLAGSTMDLTAWPGSWPMSSAFGANGKTNLEFADSGEIAVNLAGRTDLKALARSANPRLFTWTVVDGNPVIPGAEFVLDADTEAAGFKLKKDATGLRLVYTKGFMLLVR